MGRRNGGERVTEFHPEIGGKSGALPPGKNSAEGKKGRKENIATDLPVF